MALDTVPWFIGGGAEHSPAIARQLAYAATNGATGINAATDLRVTALPTPGAFVRIMPGGGVMLNRYPGGGQQSYTVRNPSATDVDVSATGSAGGSTRYVILRVDDPEFGGQAPANVVTGPYVRPVLVSSITNLAYPFVALAKIVQPANTATITQAMITDLREMANPRSPERTMYVAPVATNIYLSNTAWVDFPGVTENIRVPTWATYAVVTAQIGGLQQALGGVQSEFSLFFNGVQGQMTAIDAPSIATQDQSRTGTVLLKWESPVTAWAGSSVPLKVMARKMSGTGRIQADKYTQVVYDMQFTQGPV